MSSSPRSANEFPIRFARSRAGEVYAEASGIRIHSAYDPRREARRFVEAQTADPSPATWVVLGEALGYLTEAIRERSPQARILPISYHAQLVGAESKTAWSPASRETIEAYLTRSLGELEIEGLKVIEWAPSGAAFPREAQRAKAAVAQAVRELSGSLTTTRAFGLRWARNCLANFLALEDRLESASLGALSPLRRLAVVAASGPSLAEALPILKPLRKSILLISLPSSLSALAAAGLRPDLVVATDGGNWASLHLAEVARLPPGERLPLAMPLSAARGSWHTGGPLLLLTQATLFERELLAESRLSAIPIAAHGTVAAGALALALLLTRGPVVVAGLDLCFRDILEHVRPHTFDSIWERRESRLAPAYSAQFQRAMERLERASEGESFAARTSHAFRAYAGWFAGLADSEGRLFRLHPSPIALPGFTPLDGDALRRLSGEAARCEPRTRLPFGEAAAVPRERRAAAAAAVLARIEERLALGRRALGNPPRSGGKDSGELPIQPELGELLYELDTAGLLETKRAARVEGLEAGRTRLFASIESAEAHIAQMRAHYLG